MVPSSLPRVGMLATIRNRRAVISSVEAFGGTSEGNLHLVTLEYTDPDGVSEDTVLWEREIEATVLEPAALPDIARMAPMPAADFDALQRSARWTALSAFHNPEHETLPTLASPFFGAVQAEDFQLVPLLMALRMPRISLLLADDVGLGKTVEAGLLLTELLLRRRIRRVLILCPAGLRTQWRDEMQRKFALTFELIDRQQTHDLQRRLGMDANPWRTHSRAVASYYYLRQPDVLEQFLSVCRAQADGSAQLPWDLLIVDEAHNLMPSSFGEDSDLTEMLRQLSPYFEHKLFLTATPHNGHTRSFSGLLELLDPVRFNRTGAFSEAERRRVEQVVVRRLKSEINLLDEQANRTPRFANRIAEPLNVYFGALERHLSRAFSEFRGAAHRLIAAANRSERVAGAFAVEVLNKRLLSCPASFADSWQRFRSGLDSGDAVETREVQSARRALNEDLDDDREVQGRLSHAVRVSGAWFRALAERLGVEIAAIDRALAALFAEDGLPHEDARYDQLVTLINRHLREGVMPAQRGVARGKKWVADERLIVFTEYKTTLDYLERRLRETYGDTAAIRVLYGGMEMEEREAIKWAFNDPTDPVRVLLATDAASEGLNLQETARLLLHYDVPWNPSRMDQRNGRLDRHGQARDVTCYHFTSDDDADLKFLGHVIEKVHQIREDLGSMGEVFDAAFASRFTDLTDSTQVIRSLDDAVQSRRGRTSVPRAQTIGLGSEQRQALAEFAEAIDLSPETLKETLEVALGIDVGLPRLEEVATGRYRLRAPIPSAWQALIDQTLRLEDSQALPGLVFDANQFVEVRGGRPVFRPSRDAVLMHLGHPLFHQALARFARARFPGDAGAASRWTVRVGEVPADCEALVLVTVEELAVNELREAFHHWVHTLRLPVRQGRLGEPLAPIPAAQDRASSSAVTPERTARAREIWEMVDLDVRDAVAEMGRDLTAILSARLRVAYERARREEQERFRSRLKEVEAAMSENTLAKLAKERDALLESMQQLKLFTEFTRELERKVEDLEAELARRRHHFESLKEQLERERNRILEQVLPKRFRLRSEAQVFPVTVEIRLSEGAR